MHEVLSGRASERVSDPANVLLAADADSFSALSGLVDQSAPPHRLGHHISNGRNGRHRPSNHSNYQPGEPIRSQH